MMRIFYPQKSQIGADLVFCLAAPGESMFKVAF
jgi:hypothetical protein